MPTEVMIEADPTFLIGEKAKKRTQRERDAHAEAVKAGPLKVDYSVALDNMAMSGGMYRLVQAETERNEVPVRKIEEYANDELKIMLVSLGIKTEKVMKRGDIIDLIYKKMGEIDIVGDDEEPVL
jgi:hypothetical protein